MSEEQSQWGDSEPMIKVEAEMTEQQATALAQFSKRVTWQDIRTNVVDDNETSVMLEAIKIIQDGLSEAGFSPR